LAQISPFNRLQRDARQRLASHGSERSVVPGELVVREVEAGDEFYLVADGAFHVLGRAFDGTDLVLARLETGSCFGEQSLLSEHAVKRTASVRAVTRGRLIVLPRFALKEAGEADALVLEGLRDLGEGQKAERSTFFRDRILSGAGIGGGYTIEHFNSGQYVFHEGEAGEKIYLIVSGRAQAMRESCEPPQVLAELLPGQFFGELAILKNTPRAASVQATETLEVAALDGAWFRGTLEQNPRLRSLMASLQSMYVLPNRGLVTLQSGDLGSRPSLTAVHHLADGRRVISVRFTEAQAFRAQIVGAKEATSTARFSDQAARTLRQIHVSEQRIVEIESEGTWHGLGVVFERMLDGGIIDSEELAGFEASGELGNPTPPARDAAEVVCRCSGVTAAEIVSAITKGCVSVDQIAGENRATTVCGGCIPTVKEFLGQGEWLPATCESSINLAPDIRMFRLRTLPSEILSFAGQHIVVQARIRGRWVQRPYTIASAQGGSGSYELVVRQERHGLLSRWLFDQLKEGGALRVSMPRGSFCIAPGHTRDIVFLAGGIGITPALPWREALERSPGRGHSPLIILHLPRMSLCIVTSLMCCRVLIRASLSDSVQHDATDGSAPKMSRFLICGSPSYVAGLTALAEGCGVPAAHIEAERFIPWG
jgi:CRP-like cAMP-binding protein/ferredoxin-NADP reductase